MKKNFAHYFTSVAIMVAMIALAMPATAQGRRPGGHGGGNAPSAGGRSSATVQPPRSTSSRVSSSGASVNRNAATPSNHSVTMERSNRSTTGTNRSSNFNNDNNRPSRPSGGNMGGDNNRPSRPSGGNMGGDNNRPSRPNGSNMGGDNNRPGRGNRSAITPDGSAHKYDRGSNNGDGFNRPGGENRRPGGDNGFNRPGGDNRRPGGNMGNHRPGGDNRRPGGDNRRPGGNMGNHRPGGDNHRPGGSPRPNHGGINHGGPRPDYNRYRWTSSFHPRTRHDRWYDHYRYNRWSWRAPIAPPHRMWRPRIIWYYRPIIPVGFRYYASAPIITGVLGLEFGTYLDASLNYLYYNGYNIDGYQDNVVYLRDVQMMGYSWPDVMLQYDNGGGMCYAQFTTSSSYQDNYRFDSLYNSLCSTYGSPISGSNGEYSWYGGNGTGFINLYFNYDGGRYYTVLTFGA